MRFSRLGDWFGRVVHRLGQISCELELSFIESYVRNYRAFSEGKRDYSFAVDALRKWARSSQLYLQNLCRPDLQSRIETILTDLERIRQYIARQKRREAIERHYIFSNKVIQVSKEIKQSIPAEGGFVYFAPPIPLSVFPSFIAGFLKYKKHEWRIIGFETKGIVPLAWANKGADANKVTLKISWEQVIQEATKLHCTSVLDLHNHPNPAPSYISTGVPSEQDLQSAKHAATLLAARGMAYFGFVCERGMWFEYYRRIPDSIELFPLSAFLPPPPCIPELDFCKEKPV